MKTSSVKRIFNIQPSRSDAPLVEPATPVPEDVTDVKGKKPVSWGARFFLILSLVGGVQALYMIGLEVGRYLYVTGETGRLERQISELEQEKQVLTGIIAHKNDAGYREQLAREAGFIYPNETRLLIQQP